MFHTDTPSPYGDGDPALEPVVEPRSVPHDSLSEPPASSSWHVVTAPWGTPGNHLTGPIPRIRKRRDGSLTHGEES